MKTIAVEVPDIGDFADVPVIEILVKPGDTVKAEDSLLTLESDKATMDVPSPASGVVREVIVGIGDRVSKGVVVLRLDTTDASTAAAPEAPAAPLPAPAPAPASAPAPAPAPAPSAAAPAPPAAGAERGAAAHASPLVRNFARELGVDLERVTGSGPRGRIRHEDVQGFVRQALSGGARPAGNRETIAQATQFDQADVTALEAFRVALDREHAKSGVEITLLAFLICAAAAALKRFPEFNASIGGDEPVLEGRSHIGFAVDTPGGLVVPVIRDAGRKGVLEIARETAALAAKARAGVLGPDDALAGAFSICSLGDIGGTAFTPVVSAPAVAILGVSRPALQPVWDGTAFAPRLMLPLSLSYDHEAIDGAAAARFTTHLAALLADLRRAIV